MKTYLRILVMGFVGLLISEVLAWLYLSIFPRQVGVALEGVSQGVHIMIAFGIVGIAIGLTIGFIKVGRRR